MEIACSSDIVQSRTSVELKVPKLNSGLIDGSCYRYKNSMRLEGTVGSAQAFCANVDNSRLVFGQKLSSGDCEVFDLLLKAACRTRTRAAVPEIGYKIGHQLRARHCLWFRKSGHDLIFQL